MHIHCSLARPILNPAATSGARAAPSLAWPGGRMHSTAPGSRMDMAREQWILCIELLARAKDPQPATGLHANA
eukprot:9472318-Pyramimonas_sp.AAC.1